MIVGEMPYRKRRERRQKKERKNMKRKEAISCEGNRNPLNTQHSQTNTNAQRTIIDNWKNLERETQSKSKAFVKNH
mgnify:CR=1 FL=1